jgi:hypothetical protein
MIFRWYGCNPEGNSRWYGRNIGEKISGGTAATQGGKFQVARQEKFQVVRLQRKRKSRLPFGECNLPFGEYNYIIIRSLVIDFY